jgi:hypothetical protein
MNKMTSKKDRLLVEVLHHYHEVSVYSVRIKLFLNNRRYGVRW